jgi:hypothetical protein
MIVICKIERELTKILPFHLLVFVLIMTHRKFLEDLSVNKIVIKIIKKIVGINPTYI